MITTLIAPLVGHTQVEKLMRFSYLSMTALLSIFLPKTVHYIQGLLPKLLLPGSQTLFPESQG
jgi:hypothetical protein